MEHIRSAFSTLLVILTIGYAQTVAISGVVTTSDGKGIAGAMVRLGKVGLITTTAVDGRFILTGTSNGIRPSTDHSVPHTNCPFTLSGNTFCFTGSEPGSPRLTVYDCNGRCLFAHDYITLGGKRSIMLPCYASGIYFYCIALDHTEYVFKYITGITKHEYQASVWKKTSPVTLAKTDMQLDDALLCSKEGYQLSRLIVTNPEMLNVTIPLVPFETGTVTDINGYVYKTIRYGNQEWTVENIRTTKYNDGEDIPLISDSATWSTLETAGYCFFYYTNDLAEQKKWGAFYNWDVVSTGKLAPAGWHVPTDEDWDTLQQYLIANGYNYEGTTNENHIAKSIAAKTDWLVSEDDPGSVGNDTLRNNISGFSGLANGYCDYAGITYYRNWYAFWWTSSRQDSSFIKLRGISYHGNDLKSAGFTKVYGLSVRLVRD